MRVEAQQRTIPSEILLLSHRLLHVVGKEQDLFLKLWPSAPWDSRVGLKTSGFGEMPGGPAAGQTKHCTFTPNMHPRCPASGCETPCGLLSQAGQGLSLLQWPQAQNTQPLTTPVTSPSGRHPCDSSPHTLSHPWSLCRGL